MALTVKLIAAVATTIIAASAAAYLAVNSQNAGPSPKGRGAENLSAEGGAATAESSDDVLVCVGGDDGVLRVPLGFAAECPEGQQELRLTDDDERICGLCDPLEDPPRDPRSDDPAVAALEQRILKLENTAYFEVVSQKDEHRILSVGPGGVRFFNDSEEAVAAVGTTDSGGFFTGRSAVSATEASIGASGNNAGVRIFDNGLARAELATREGPYALRFPSAKGLISGLGQSRAGTGAVTIGTLPGVTQASMIVTDGRGMVSFSKDGGPGGLAIAEALAGGGLLDVANARGDSAVKMGHSAHRYGIVLAGPVPGLPYVPRSGLPGSYFMGCASGEKPACIPEVAGQ